MKKHRVRWHNSDIPKEWAPDFLEWFVPLLKGALAYEVPFTPFPDAQRDKLFRYTVRAHGGQTPKPNGPVMASVSLNSLITRLVSLPRFIPQARSNVRARLEATHSEYW